MSKDQNVSDTITLHENLILAYFARYLPICPTKVLESVLHYSVMLKLIEIQIKILNFFSAFKDNCNNLFFFKVHVEALKRVKKSAISGIFFFNLTLKHSLF